MIGRVRVVPLIAVVRLTTQAVDPLEVGGPQGWLHTEFGVENCEDFLVGILAVVLLRDTTHTDCWLVACIAQYYRLQTRGSQSGFRVILSVRLWSRVLRLGCGYVHSNCQLWRSVLWGRGTFVVWLQLDRHSRVLTTAKPGGPDRRSHRLTRSTRRASDTACSGTSNTCAAITFHGFLFSHLNLNHSNHSSPVVSTSHQPPSSTTHVSQTSLIAEIK